MALNLNYKPNVFVKTENLTEDEWLAYRRKGIGGSDVASALGLSPYRTKRELYYDKIGVEPVVPDEDKSIMFQIGHLLEDVVAQIFAKKTGFSVFRDQTMYQHPLFPFMLADVDFFILFPDGTYLQMWTGSFIFRMVARPFWNVKRHTTIPCANGPMMPYLGTMSFRFATI